MIRSLLAWPCFMVGLIFCTVGLVFVTAARAIESSKSDSPAP